MFGFFKKEKATEFDGNYFPINSDMHSHILPGLDDGSPDIETSLELIKGLIDLGITRSVATPHIIGDVYRNTADTIFPALDSLQTALAEKNIDFEVAAAAEYQLDDYFLQLLRSKEKLLTLSGNHLLTEFSFTSYPQNHRQILFEILQAGYTPVLAHPERYIYLHNKKEMYHELAEAGFLLQVNLNSLTGYYGKKEMVAAHYLLENHLVSFAGTDLHHARHMEHLSAPASRAIFNKAFAGAFISNTF